MYEDGSNTDVASQSDGDGDGDGDGDNAVTKSKGKDNGSSHDVKNGEASYQGDVSTDQYGNNTGNARKSLGIQPEGRRSSVTRKFRDSTGPEGQETMLEFWRSSRRMSDGSSIAFRNSFQRSSSIRFSNLSLDRVVRKSRSSQTYISCLIDDLEWAISALSCPSVLLDKDELMPRLEEMAIFIHESQSGESRGYHNVGRVFEVSAGASPIQLLAAFFRDTICHVIDGELSPRQQKMVENVLVPGTFRLSQSVFDDRATCLAARIFGYEPDDDLQNSYKFSNGMDVFLSSIVAVRFLRPFMSLKLLAELAACLEGTIPFRPPDDLGQEAVDRLYQRVCLANEDFNLEMTEVELELCCQQSADLHNRFIGNFATADTHNFLDHTWSLLPEHYASLRREYLYTLNDFYFAVMDMRKFMASVKVMYSSFNGIPGKEEMAKFHARVLVNHSAGLAYLKTISLGLGIIAAFATLTGGADVPKSLFFGDLQPVQMSQKTIRLGDGLPEVGTLASDCNLEVYDILKMGRVAETSFDYRDAPIAAFVYGSLGEAGQSAAFEHCIHPMTTESSWKLLDSLPYKVVEAVGREVANVAASRRDMILQILEEMKQKQNE